MKYLILPAVIEALQFTDDAKRLIEIIEFADEDISVDYSNKYKPTLTGLESGIVIPLGDYLVKEVDGEIYHWSREHFELKHKQL